MSHTVTVPEFLKHFRCLGADCADSCCKGWNMQLTDADYERYVATSSELAASATGEKGSYRMQRDPASDCCVRFKEGLCSIQQTYGEDMLGEACYFYPRATRALGSHTVMTAAPSCPEIARLALYDEKAFSFSEVILDRLPSTLKNFLPDGISDKDALAIHALFMEKPLDAAIPAERVLMRMFAVAESLERINVTSWKEAVPFYFEQADARLPAPESKDTDPAFLLQALCGLVFAAKKVNNTRLMQTIGEMEQALHVKIRMDNLTIVPLPDSIGKAAALLRKWQQEYQPIYAPLLSRYLALQLSLALFPFGGFGDSMTERLAIIGIRFATVKLGLMSALDAAGKPLAEAEIIRVIQSISRFLDHLADAEFSVKIYKETGWLKKSRLRGLLRDGV